MDNWNNEVTKLLREVVLPRLDQVEYDLAELRASTWPVCQSIKDKKMPFKNITEKKTFFQYINIDEVRRLIGIKARFCGIDNVSAEQELRMITVVSE